MMMCGMRVSQKLRQGQLISSEGDEQRCRQLLAEAAEELQERLAALMKAMEADGEKVMFDETSMLRLRPGLDDAVLAAGKRLYEEVSWGRVVRGKSRSVYSWYRKLYPLWGDPLWKMLSSWAQIRETPGVVIHLYLADVWSVRGGAGRLTVAADGVVQLSVRGGSAVPATEDSLREWIDRWKAEVPAWAWTAQREHKKRSERARVQDMKRRREAKAEAERARAADRESIKTAMWRDAHRRSIDYGIGMTSDSSNDDLMFSRIKLKEAMTLVRDEVALRQREDPDGPRFDELATVDDPKGLSWKDQRGRRRMYEETLGAYGDPDDDRTWWEETWTIGCRWQYGGISAVMTVNADGVVEIDAGDVKAGALTSDTLRAILDRAASQRS